MPAPLSRYTVTVTVGCDGGYLPDPATFVAAAGQVAWSRSASIISAHLADTARDSPVRLVSSQLATASRRG